MKSRTNTTLSTSATTRRTRWCPRSKSTHSTMSNTFYSQLLSFGSCFSYFLRTIWPRLNRSCAGKNYSKRVVDNIIKVDFKRQPWQQQQRQPASRVVKNYAGHRFGFDRLSISCLLFSFNSFWPHSSRAASCRFYVCHSTQPSTRSFLPSWVSNLSS